MSGWVLVVAEGQASVLPGLLAEQAFKTLDGPPAEDTLELLRRERPDAVLIDCTPPLPSLLDFCRVIKGDPIIGSTPVIIVTADPDCRRQAMDAGADDFLTPPFDAHVLPTRLRALMRFKQTIDAAALRDVPVGDVPVGEAGGDVSIPHILVVEDDELARERLVGHIEAIGWRAQAAGDGDACVAQLLDDGIDLVIISLDLDRDAQGHGVFELVARLRGRPDTRLLPILLLFDDADGHDLSRGLELGADDYIARPIVPEELMLRVKLQLKRKLVRDRLRESLTSIHRPLTDRLTGVYSQGFLATHLARVSLPDAPRQEFSALMLGVDGYPALAAAQGQEAMDLILAELGRRLLSNVRPFDLVARYDDAVFVILMPQTGGSIAFQIAERLRHGLTSPVDASGKIPNVTISIGVAQREEPWRDPADLLRRAGAGLAVAVIEGGNRVAAGPAS